MDLHLMRAEIEGVPLDEAKARSCLGLDWELNRWYKMWATEDLVNEFSDDEGLDIMCGPNGCYIVMSEMAKLGATLAAGEPHNWYKMNQFSAFNFSDDDDPDQEFWYVDLLGPVRSRVDQSRFRDFGVLTRVAEGVRTVHNMEQKDLLDGPFMTVPILDMLDAIPKEGKANALRMYLRNTDPR